jgi:predicted GNAT family acetyltransferase
LSADGIRHERSGSKGRYVLERGGEAAELTLPIASPRLVIADHADVPDSFRCTGAGQALVERLVADARAEGFKVIALCPVVQAQSQRHPEWADVFG